MPLELQKRQHALVGDTIRRVEAAPTGSPRILRQSYPSHGVGYSVAIVPRTDIPKATRPGGSGMEFCPGKGTAYLFRIDDVTGCVVPWLDSDGNVIFKDVFNFSFRDCPSNDVSFTLEDGSLYTLEDDTPFELEADSGSTDFIGAETCVLMAIMDRNGKLCIPPDEDTVGASSTKMAKTAEIIDAFDNGTLTPGSGKVEVYEFTNGVIADSTITITVFNEALYDIPNNEFVLIHQEAGDDRWMIAAFGENSIKGFSGPDGTEILFPYDAMQIFGDRDQSPVLGNIIDVQISKAGIVVGISISAVGDMFKFVDVQSPTPGEVLVALGDTITMSTSIDETLLTQFAEWRITGDTMPLVFGKVFDCIADSGDVDIFPLETLEIKGSGGTNVTVSKAVNTVTYTISGVAGDGRVKVRTTDVLDFLEDQFIDWITDGDGDRFASAQDMLVEFQTDPIVAGTEQLRGFVNSSDITGYSASGEFHLALDDNVLQWIAPSAAITWTAKGDLGVNQTISGGDTLFLQGTLPTGVAGSAANRGIVTTGVAGDIVQISVDATVMQEVLLSGSGTSGDATIPIENGTRNQLRITSSTTAGANVENGYIEVDGTAAAGDIEFILRRDGKVRVRSGDAIDYLEDQFVNWIIDADGDRYEAAQDPLVELQTEGAVGSEELRAFINSSDITGYSASGELHLALDSNVLQWKAPPAVGGFSFCVSGDKGVTEEINDTDTFLLEGSNLIASATVARRGVVTTGSVTDTVEFSVDQTVAQEINMTGSATTGTSLIQASAGTRNRFDFISSVSSTVEEAGTTGWIELKGDGVGGIEFILHEQSTVGGFSFCIDGDKGVVESIEDTNTILFEGSNLTASITAGRRGIVTTVSVTDTVEFSVDETVAQEINVTGTATTGTSLIQASAGTRNRFDFVSNTASTVEEVGSKGWVELKGDGFGGIEFILHEQATTGYSFCINGDKGVGTQVIADGDIADFEGSGVTRTAAAAVVDRGIVTTSAFTDRIEFSVDETVHQITNLSGTGATGTINVLIEDGTRNRLDLISSCTSAIEESGPGWIEIKGDVTGGVEFILHEKAASEWTVAGDKGTPQLIEDGDVLDLVGSNLAPAASSCDRGIVTTATATDTVEFSIDETVMTEFLLSGSGQSGNTNVFVKDLARNQIELVSTTIPVQEAGDGYIEIKGSLGTVEFILHQQAVGSALPIGAFIESGKAPILSGGKRYIDRGGVADTDWAYMDGTSNSAPGGGQDRRNYFVRGSGDLAAVTNTAFGRSEASSTTDSDEAVVTVDDHTDHIHTIDADVCHGDVTGETHFDFSMLSNRPTTIQKQVGGAALTLDHDVVITNNSATPDANLEMLPAFKKTHWFEKVA